MELEEQQEVLNNTKKRLLVSASAGSGKTYVMIKYICKLIVEKKVPTSSLLVLTFTRAAATQMKERLIKNLKEQQMDNFLLEQLDAISTANICTIHSFCERALKKYASILNLNENFSLLDENLANSFKERAFNFCIKQFESSCPQEYDYILGCYKNNKNKIRDIIFEIEKLAVAVADQDEFLNSNKQNLPEYFEKALNFLHENFAEFLKEQIAEVKSLHLQDFEDNLKKSLLPFFKAKDLFELSATPLQLPKTPLKKQIGEEAAAKIVAIKKNIVQKFDKITSLKLQDEENVEKQKSGVLEKGMLKLFELYQKAYNSLKASQNVLDFSDLEKYMKELSKNTQLFAGFEYVFVDEYQDTNKIQEKIIKNVAKNCNFVAVGDLKQGIYGFRLASSEIFLNDQNTFLQDSKNSSVKFLKSNFRSCQAVLDFVNSIFQVCMTKPVTAVDYKGTSMLKARNTFLDEGERAINIDLVCDKETEAAEPPEFYSVKEAEIFKDISTQNLLKDIKRRIQEVMLSKISENGQLRSVRYSDIALLSRSRGAFFEELENYLQENNIPVLSNSRNHLMDEPEMKMLLSVLKISLAQDDEVALASVLLSGIGGFDIEQILQEKVGTDKTLQQIVQEDKNGTFAKFNENLQNFRVNSQVFGIKKAFLQLFDETNYISYLNLKPNGTKLNMFVERFLEQTENFNFDAPALINYLETVEIDVVPEVSSFGDCITLTTIHDSKGLEYPIVFLIGCDRSLSGGRGNYDVQVTERFGMALKIYDIENNSEVGSVRMLAGQESEKQKNFVEEIFLFYVALTRAKNRLYLFGRYNEKCFEKYTLKDCDSYFDFIFFALKDVKNKFLNSGEYLDKNLSVNLIEEVEELSVGNRQDLQNAQILPEDVKKIEDYLNFQYKFGQEQNFKLKESVTSLTNKNAEVPILKHNNENFNFGGKAIEIGNAYHLALKLLDFNSVKDVATLHAQLLQTKEQVDLHLIDEQVLLKNVLLLKDITQGAKVFKEKEFLMKDSLSNLLGADCADETLVQGVVDLFAIKDNKIILVDYKYSNLNAAELEKKYFTQLKLYKMALEYAFGLKVEKVFLLSLKNAELLNVAC